MTSGIPELRAVLEPEARAWLDSSVDRILADPTAIGALFPAVRRRGRAGIDGHWTVDEAARPVLLTALPLHDPALIDTVFAPAALDGVS
ncbi:hypothetical protein ACFYO0_18525 [Streptomyces sp. NPDC006365]|uniref:hypothetical protein n=1 Tax=Streptomyces sp. NPDC006365 TaxID=3364744 RepID=UPI0036B85040